MNLDNEQFINDNKTHLTTIHYHIFYLILYYSVDTSKGFLLTHLTLRATHFTFFFTFFLICLLYNIHWFCLFFLFILFITSLNLILINNCNLSLCFSQTLTKSLFSPLDHVYLHIFFGLPWWQHFLASILPQV